MPRSTFLKLRVSPDEAERFNARAAALGVSVSQMIRDTALHGAVYVTVDRAQAGYEFRRLGAMLKHLYPARDMRWTAEDRKKWWALIHDLLSVITQFDGLTFTNGDGQSGQDVQRPGQQNGTGIATGAVLACGG